MDYRVLRVLIQTMPSHESATDAEALAYVLAAEPSPAFKDVPWLEYMIWLGEVDGLEKLEAAIASGSSTQAVKAAARLAVTIANAGQDLAVSDSRVRTQLNKLVPDVLSTTERNNLLSVSRGSPARWETVGLDRAPILRHVTRARAG